MNQILQPHWIGYHLLETWLHSVDRTRPVFACLSSEASKSDSRGMWRENRVIFVAQPAGDLVHYFRLPVASLRYLDGRPFDPDHKQKCAGADRDWLSMRSWLTEQGLTVVDGLLAAPIGVRLLDAFDTSWKA